MVNQPSMTREQIAALIAESQRLVAACKAAREALAAAYGDPATVKEAPCEKASAST